MLSHTLPCPSSHLALCVCSISCPWVSLSLPCSAFFSLLSFLLRAVPCNYLIFPSPCPEISAGFPWDAHPWGRHSTRSAHPSWSCSQLEGRMGLGHKTWGGGVCSPCLCCSPTHRSLFLLSGASSWKHLGSGKSKAEWTVPTAGTVAETTVASLSPLLRTRDTCLVSQQTFPEAQPYQSLSRVLRIQQ